MLAKDLFRQSKPNTGSNLIDRLKEIESKKAHTWNSHKKPYEINKCPSIVSKPPNISTNLLNKFREIDSKKNKNPPMESSKYFENSKNYGLTDNSTSFEDEEIYNSDTSPAKLKKPKSSSAKKRFTSKKSTLKESNGKLSKNNQINENPVKTANSKLENFIKSLSTTTNRENEDGENCRENTYSFKDDSSYTDANDLSQISLSFHETSDKSDESLNEEDAKGVSIEFNPNPPTQKPVIKMEPRKSFNFGALCSSLKFVRSIAIDYSVDLKKKQTFESHIETYVEIYKTELRRFLAQNGQSKISKQFNREFFITLFSYRYPEDPIQIIQDHERSFNTSISRLRSLKFKSLKREPTKEEYLFRERLQNICNQLTPEQIETGNVVLKTDSKESKLGLPPSYSLITAETYRSDLFNVNSTRGEKFIVRRIPSIGNPKNLDYKIHSQMVNEIHLDAQKTTIAFMEFKKNVYIDFVEKNILLQYTEGTSVVVKEKTKIKIYNLSSSDVYFSIKVASDYH